MIGELLGHRKVQTTARYAHLARDSVRQVAAVHYRLHKTPTIANRVVETLPRLFYKAEAWGVG